MYQPSTPPSAPLHIGRTALIYGLGAGVALGLVECAVDIYTIHTRGNAFSPLGELFNLLLWITALLLIGALAGRRVGKTSAGALVGLWTGMSSSIVLAISGFFILLSFSVDYLSSSSSYLSFDVNGLVALYLSALLIFVVVMMSIGTGLGALGALIGQSFSTPAFASVQQYQQSDPPQSRETGED